MHGHHGLRLTPTRQIDIYRRNLNGVVQGVLKQIYSVCSRILGEAYFNQLCRSYRYEHPSEHSDLNQYGGHFAEFLGAHIRQNEHLLDYIYLPDLATLEWHWHASYYAADEAAFDFAGLERLDEPQQSNVVLDLAPSVNLLHTAYPILAIWRANRHDSVASQEFEHDGSATYYLIYRQKLERRIEQLSISDYAILRAIREKQTLGELSNQFARDLSQRLPVLIHHGWVSGYHRASE